MAELKHIESKSSRRQNEKPGLATGGGGGYDDAMEARVNKLEEFAIETRDRLSRIETRLDNCATKADIKDLEATMYKEFAVMHKEFSVMHKEFSVMHKEFATLYKALDWLTWKLIGAAGLLVSAVYFIATQVKP
ncbi:hypothetical protein [Collimonas sp.]|jgi:hypothetical protein|uniref:hypothetical protein n=1 Tax=Collimonas sp. TaxID=1963772 RepID=UPI002CF1F2F5|nr:hypothetical protein [Collimonas sp.]HWX03329.1 hypothetical protein [Collimonas sp.]